VFVVVVKNILAILETCATVIKLHYDILSWVGLTDGWRFGVSGCSNSWLYCECFQIL